MVSLETRISIKSMLLSSDKEVKTLGWNLFVNEYETVIVKRIRFQPAQIKLFVYKNIQI